MNNFHSAQFAVSFKLYFLIHDVKEKRKRIKSIQPSLTLSNADATNFKSHTRGFGSSQRSHRSTRKEKESFRQDTWIQRRENCLWQSRDFDYCDFIYCTTHGSSPARTGIVARRIADRTHGNRAHRAAEYTLHTRVHTYVLHVFRASARNRHSARSIGSPWQQDQNTTGRFPDKQRAKSTCTSCAHVRSFRVPLSNGSFQPIQRFTPARFLEIWQPFCGKVYILVRTRFGIFELIFYRPRKSSGKANIHIWREKIASDIFHYLAVLSIAAGKSSINTMISR